MKNKKRNLKSIQRVVVIILLAICIFTGCNTVDDIDSTTTNNNYNLAVIDATDDFYVNDFAGIFSEAEKSNLMDKALSMEKEYDGIQVVVTTIESFEKTVVGEKPLELTIEQLSYSMYSQYGIGKDSMGILILFSVGDREVKIETGYKMQMYFTDYLSKQILNNYGKPYFTEDRFAEGLISVQEAVIEEIQNCVPADWNKMEDTEVEKEVSTETSIITVEDSNKNNLVVFLGTIVTVIIGAFAGLWAGLRNKFTKKIRLEKQNSQKMLSKKDDEHFRILSEQQNEYEERISEIENEAIRKEVEKNSQIAGLNLNLQAANLRINQLTQDLSCLQDKYSRIQFLHPEFNFDKEVEEMIEKEYKDTALEIDKQLAAVVLTAADKENIAFFSDAITLYEQTIPEVKKYIITDMEKVMQLHKDSITIKQEFERQEREKRDRNVANIFLETLYEMLFDIQQIGNHETYKELENMYEEYEKLSSEQKEFISDSSQVKFLQKLYKEAKCDNDDFCKAKEAEKFIQNVVDGIYFPDEDDVDDLKSAMNKYEKLSSNQKKYFSAELLQKLKRLLEDAEEDERRQERRRRQNSSYTNLGYHSRPSSKSSQRNNLSSSSRPSSYRSNSVKSNRPSAPSSSRNTFRGHGGRPSGGGASMKF